MDEGRTGSPVRIRVAYPQELDRLTAEYEGGSAVPKARWAAPQEGFRCEKLVYEVDYEVSASRALKIQPTESDRGMPLSDVLGFGLLVCGDGRRATLRMQMVDASDQTFELTYGQIDWIGWRYVRFNLSTDRFWGGNRNGQIHWPIRYQTVATLDSAAGSVEGTIQIACPTVLVAP